MKILYNTQFTDGFKTDLYTLNFLMPLTEENATHTALLVQVLKRECEKYGEMDKVAGKLGKLYGAAVHISSDKIGENISFTVQASYLDNRFALDGEDICAQCMDIMANMLLSPALENGIFKSNYVEQEKQNLADYIRSIVNDKRTYSVLRLKEIMFENEAYRFTSSGTIECLERITAKSLYEFYQNVLKNSRILVSYIGRKTDVTALTEKYFSDLSEEKEIMPLTASAPKAPETVRYCKEAYDVMQAKLCIGYRFNGVTEYYATRLFNVIFGGSPTSKLFMNVRERLSLCYYCSSNFDPYVNSMFISSGIEEKNYEVAKNEIFAQLEDMKQANISEEEFENGKLYLLDYVKGIRDSLGLLAGQGVHDFLLNIHDSIDEQLEKIQAVTMEQVVSVANKAVLDTVYCLHGKEGER